MRQNDNTNNNTYVMDSESAAEMARLTVQDRLITLAAGSSFPGWEEQELAVLHRVLDIGCGPGGWVLGAAKRYPHIHFTGIDISNVMISYAQVQAAREISGGNARFAVMNALEHLNFPTGSFDLVQIRTAVGWLPREQWPGVLGECSRVLRPGGIIQLGESDLTLTNKPACERWRRLIAQLLHRKGFGFSPDCETFGMTPMLGKLLKDAGYQDLRAHPFVIDASFGAPFYPLQFDDARRLLQTIQPLLVGMSLASQIELTRLYVEFEEEVQQHDYRSLAFWLMMSGRKPNTSPSHRDGEAHEDWIIQQPEKK